MLVMVKLVQMELLAQYMLQASLKNPMLD
jgi:hypothetical protein